MKLAMFDQKQTKAPLIPPELPSASGQFSTKR